MICVFSDLVLASGVQWGGGGGLLALPRQGVKMEDVMGGGGIGSVLGGGLVVVLVVVTEKGKQKACVRVERQMAPTLPNHPYPPQPSSRPSKPHTSSVSYQRPHGDGTSPLLPSRCR